MRWALLIALLLPACGSEAPPFPQEVGFVSVDPEPAAPATGHMFYVLSSADSDPGKKPVFVFFNGGPGVPTSTNLLVDATGPEQFIVDAGQGTVVKNAASFTRLGSLLYIDERETGFSYDDAPAYSCTFDMQQDAIDFTRAILRVLDTHPQLTASRIVLVGESYGGVRAQLILQDLLHYTQVPEITTEVQQHLDTVFAAEAVHPPDEIARQFFAQVLIQPVVVGAYQKLRPRPPSGICPNDTRLTYSDCANQYALVLGALADPVQSTKLLGARLEDVAGLAGPARHGARCAGTLDDPSNAFNTALLQRLGPLDPGDTYFGFNGMTGSWETDTTLEPPAFVDNLSYVRTLITNATYDGIVDTTQIPPALVAFGVPATLDQTPRSGIARPGWIDVTLPGGGSATIRLPTYPAGHMVTATDAAELRTDTAAWLGL